MIAENKPNAANVRPSSRIVRWAVTLAVCALTAVLLARWWSARAEQRLQAHLQAAPLSELQRLAKQRDWDPQVFYWLGLRLTAAGQPDAAMQALARASGLDPQTAGVRDAFLIARRQAFQAHLRRASAAELQTLTRKRPDNPEAFYWLGVRLTEQGRHREAAAALRRSVALNARSAAARAALGLALARIGQPFEAETELKQALALDPDLTFAHFTLGNLYGRYKRWEQAAPELKAASEQNPGDLETRYLLAICYGELYQEDKKMDVLERLVQDAPNNIRFLKSLGYVYLFFGKFAEAEAKYRQILSLAPNDLETHYLLGRALAELANTPQDFAAAEEELQNVVALAPDNPGGHLALGILFFRRDRPALAIPELERAVKLGDHESKTWMYLGQAYARVGRTADAKRTLTAFQRAASLNRDISHLENRLLNTPETTPAFIRDKNSVRVRLARVLMDDHQYARALRSLDVVLAYDKADAAASKLARECRAHLQTARSTTVSSTL